VQAGAGVDSTRRDLNYILMHTGTTPKKKKTPADAHAERLADSVETMTVDEPRVKSKNLNVVDEFEKSGSKRLANFVVVGMYTFHASIFRSDMNRSRRSRQKHTHGPPFI
jgi:hypothetical protein